jgi:hypothetical protein
VPLNSAGTLLMADTLQETLLFAQLHSDIAGVDGTDNIAVAGRQPIVWGTPDSDGNFGLLSPLDFTDGEPDSGVYSITVWDTETDGACYGELPFGSGDLTFNAAGEYSVTVIDFTPIMEGS